MKKLSLLLNLVLIVAVGYLYYKVYTTPQAVSKTTLTGEYMPSNGIVYIDSDTLLAHYEFFKDLKAGFEQKQDSIDKMLESRGRALEKDVQVYQEKAGTMSAEQRSRTEEQLMGRQENLVSLRRKLLSELSDQEDKINDSLHNSLHDYLKEYNKEKNYLFILGYQRGTGILLANDSLDVTKEVLTGLNNRK